MKKESESEGTANYVSSKFGKNSKWFLNNAGDSFTVTDFSNANILSLSGSSDYEVGALTADEAENIDTKIDDGIADSGLVRALEYSGSAVTTGSYDSDKTERNVSLVSKMDF